MASNFARLIEEKRVTQKLKEPIELDSIQPHNKSSNGRTLEDYLGISENNKQNSDLGFYEVKTTSRTNTYIKLFTKTPIRSILFERSVIKYLTRKYGKQQDDKLSFYCKIELNSKISYNGYEIYYVLIEDKLIVYFEKENIILDEISWSITDLKSILIRKMPNLIHTTTTKLKDTYIYHNSNVYDDLNINNFMDLLYNGDIIIDFNVHQRDDGKLKDHGCGFLLHKDKLKSLFDVNRKV
jgi:hypothetical protein